MPQPPSEIAGLGDGSRTDSQLKQYNDAAAEQFNNKVLDKCNGCGRTFNPEAFVKHQKMCGGGGKSSSSLPPPIIVRPKALMCYICGREFGTASLDIHLKSCKKKWENEQAMKPLKERKPLPQAPEEMADIPLTN